jgi:hypothetical protein
MDSCFGDMQPRDINVSSSNENWVQHFDPETKPQSVEWRHTTSPEVGRPGLYPHLTKLQELKNTSWLIFCRNGEIINVTCYVQVLKKQRRELREKRPVKETVILQHNSQLTLHV